MLSKTSIKPRVNWKPEKSRWVVSDNSASINFDTWSAAFRYAFLRASMEGEA